MFTSKFLSNTRHLARHSFFSTKRRPPPPPPPPPRRKKTNKVSSKEEMMALLQDAKPKARRKPVITTTPTSSTPSPTSASVPMMITKQMRLQLSQDANLTEAQIRKLTPQQAHDILDKIPKPKSTASTSSTISSDKTTLHPLTGNKVKSSKNKDATPKEGAPTSMAGPALGGLFGFVVAFGGAGYYFFGNNDEEEASPFNTVVQMIRGKEEDNDGTNASSSSTNNDDMSLEEYEKLQASNQFSKTLENVKGLGASSLPEKDKNENTNTNDTTTNQTDTEPKRELTMMEKLEQAKRRGNTAGISSKKLKRLPPQKPAWMLAEEKERVEKGTKYSLEPEKPKWMKDNNKIDTAYKSSTPNTPPTTTTPSTKSETILPAPVTKEPKQTKKEMLLAGMNSMLKNQRDRESEYKKLHNIGAKNTSFFSRRKEIHSKHKDILQGFQDEKKRIKRNIKEIKASK